MHATREHKMRSVQQVRELLGAGQRRYFMEVGSYGDIITGELLIPQPSPCNRARGIYHEWCV
jgi:hypothetical protein